MSTATKRRHEGRAIHAQPPPDVGCRFAPRCMTCPWSTCYYAMAPAERRAFTEALTAIQPFVRRPDTALPTD